jgi:hypothetical protein
MPSAGDPQVYGYLYRRIVHQRIDAATPTAEKFILRIRE